MFVVAVAALIVILVHLVRGRCLAVASNHTSIAPHVHDEMSEVRQIVRRHDSRILPSLATKNEHDSMTPAALYCRVFNAERLDVPVAGKESLCAAQEVGNEAGNEHGNTYDIAKSNCLETISSPLEFQQTLRWQGGRRRRAGQRSQL